MYFGLQFTYIRAYCKLTVSMEYMIITPVLYAAFVSFIIIPWSVQTCKKKNKKKMYINEILILMSLLVDKIFFQLAQY